MLGWRGHPLIYLLFLQENFSLKQQQKAPYDWGNKNSQENEILGIILIKWNEKSFLEQLCFPSLDNFQLFE